ncbi:MAG: hypothetical protein FJ100_13675 [Deltaproteobacteria bacterium]|nr:hypothetical protein [Deltaproteobacteria bacterium]
MVQSLAAAGCDAEPPPAVAPAEAVDGPGLAVGLAARAGWTTALVHAKLMSTTLLADLVALDPAASPSAIADAVAVHAQKAKASCGGLSVKHVPGTPAVEIALPTSACKVGGHAASGFVDVAVAIQDGVATATVQFGAIKVRGHALAGTLKVAVGSDKVHTTTWTAFKVDGHTWNWSGTAKLDDNGAGATVDGSGTVATADGKTIAVALQGVHRTFAACYANAGKLIETHQVALTQPKAKVGTLVDATVTATVDAETPRDGTVDVTVAAGKIAATTHKDTALPKYGDCPDGTAP